MEGPPEGSGSNDSLLRPIFQERRLLFSPPHFQVSFFLSLGWMRGSAIIGGGISESVGGKVTYKKEEERGKGSDGGSAVAP